ncbi:unnamed protein product [Alopecurus aequalis]
MSSLHIKLAVDRSQNHVLFADAGSEFVDILLGFLMLPLSAVQCIADLSPHGCLTNLSDSVNHLRISELLKVDMCHGRPLMPTHNDVLKEVSNIEAFLRDKERFVISDEWTIKPASTRSILSLPQTFGTDGIVHGFEEVEVCVSSAEVASLLKASLSSSTVFTDAFLSKGTDVQSASFHVGKSSIHKIIPQYNKDSSSLPESKITLFYNMQEKKVMYAECNHDFVDLLLSFLTCPVGCVMKSTGAATSHLGRSFNNLYRSAIDLNATGFLTGSFPQETLLDPSLSPFDIVSHNMCRSVDCQCGKDRVPGVNLGACHHGLVEDRKYVVGDDLVIRQASAISVMKHWRGRNKAMVLEMDITIGKQEVVVLLQAMLTSKTALTDVFVSRLEEHSSLQKIQIFAKIPKGKTITLEVARSDTIATVKSRIKDKVSIPTGCRHELVYCSRYLKDSSTVAEYSIVRDCTVVCKFFK